VNSSIAFVSTGDPAEDQKLAEDLDLRDRRIAEGMCVNGCGPMNRTDADGYSAQCPVCYFVGQANYQQFEGLPFAEWQERPARKDTES
jgi:hypothetical protein